MLFRNIIFFLFLTTILSCKKNDFEKTLYPRIELSKAYDTIHSMVIQDDYRDLETLDDPKIINWFKGQKMLTDSLLNKVDNKDYFFNLIKEAQAKQKENIDNYYIYKDGSYLYTKNDTDGIIKLYYRENQSSDESILYNPADFKKDYVISYFKASWDLSKIAIALSPKGEDKSTLIIYDKTSKSLLNDELTNVSPALVGGIQWLQDNSGFYYLQLPHYRYNDPTYLLNSETRLHFLGDNKLDKVIFSAKTNANLQINKEDFPLIRIPDDKGFYEYAKISSTGDYSKTFYRKIAANLGKSSSWIPLFDEKEKIGQFKFWGDKLIYRSSKNAENFKICTVNLNKLNFDNPKVIVPEFKEKVIVDFDVVDNKVFYTTLENGIKAEFYSLINEQNTQISLPTVSGTSYVVAKGDNLYVSTSGWTKQNALYRYDYNKKNFEEVTLSKTSYPEYDDFIVKEIEIQSHDGIMVPLSIVHRKDMQLDGKNRVLLESYGAYGSSFSPFFDFSRLEWVKEGNIWAIPHIRGGGEKGVKWYNDGSKTKKSNSWKDIIACAKFLIDQNYTSPELVINYGVSAGGVVVSRSITERPDLFGVALMDSPEINTSRLDQQPNGPGNAAEFGSITDSAEFKGLMRMDAYQHIKKDTDYPAILISVGMKDGVVVPWNSGKFVAKLQNLSQTKKPVLLAVNFNSAHMGDGTLDSYYKTISHMFTFAMWQTNHTNFEPK